MTHYNIDIQVTDGTNTATSTLTVVISGKLVIRDQLVKIDQSTDQLID